MAHSLTTRCGLSLAIDGGMIYPLTSCCGASGKGGADVVVCRACYAPVEALFGDCAVDGEWGRVASWAAEVGCPCPDECAQHSTWRLLELQA